MFTKRHLSQMLLGLLAVALIVVLIWISTGMDKLTQISRQSARVGADVEYIQQQAAQLKQLESFTQQRQELRQLVAKSNLNESDWSSRVLQRPTALIAREQAEQILRLLSSKTGEQWFSAETFDVSVNVPAEGLFTQPSIADRGFNVQMNGVVYFKAAK